MPLFLVYHHPQSTSFGGIMMMDCILVILFLTFLGVEAVADQQMLEFRVIKFKEMMKGHSIRYLSDDLIDERESVFFGWKYDFCSSGLRKYCCHPQYFGEMGLWGCVLAFAALQCSVCWISVCALIGYLSLCVKLYKLAKVTEGILAYSYASYW